MKKFIQQKLNQNYIVILYYYILNTKNKIFKLFLSQDSKNNYIFEDEGIICLYNKEPLEFIPYNQILRFKITRKLQN